MRNGGEKKKWADQFTEARPSSFDGKTTYKAPCPPRQNDRIGCAWWGWRRSRRRRLEKKGVRKEMPEHFKNAEVSPGIKSPHSAGSLYGHLSETRGSVDELDHRRRRRGQGKKKRAVGRLATGASCTPSERFQRVANEGSDFQKSVETACALKSGPSLGD